MLKNADYVRIMKEDTQEKRNQVLVEIAKERQLPLACRNYSGDIRLCAKCYCIKADRAHHCSVCSACKCAYALIYELDMFFAKMFKFFFSKNLNF